METYTKEQIIDALEHTKNFIISFMNSQVPITPAQILSMEAYKVLVLERLGIIKATVNQDSVEETNKQVDRVLENRNARN